MNGPQFMRMSSLVVLFFVSVGLGTTKIHGESIVIGGSGPGSLAWEEQYAKISVLDFDTNPGHIQPAQTGSEDNIALKIIERGGTVTSPNAKIVLELSESALNEQLRKMVSGDTSQAFEVKGFSVTGIIFRIDLGERFGVNRIRFFPRKSAEGYFLKGFEISLNDGSKEQTTLAGTPDYRVFKTVERNIRPIVDLDVPLQFVRFIQVKQLVRGEWEIDEFQIFGKGFASSASYTSKVFDQGQPAVFGKIRWSGGSIGEPTKAQVTLSTRSGSTPDPGDTLSWSAWSPPYPPDVLSDIVSPAPRRYFQFRFLFASSDFLSAATVDSLTFDLSPAVADSLRGEIWPQNASIGQNTIFTYTVKSFNSRGFDRLEIETLAPVEVVRSVQIDGTDVPWEKADIPGGVQIAFPRITGDKTLRVFFDNIALQYNTVFDGRIFDSSRPDRMPQAIEAGDAALDSLATGNDLSVTIVVDKDLIHAMKVAPVPFTPNDDGINDELLVTYDIISLIDVALVSVKVYDLSGRPVKEIYSGLDSSGRYLRYWDGRNASGQRVLPGIYLVRLELDTDSGTESKTAIVSVVY